ncbi:MAG: hypothetical protein ACOCQD_03800 [archaeon]
MSEINEFVRLPEGILEIIVQDHKTQEVTYRQKYRNQIQDWLKNALSYLSAGRMFTTWGHHGETISDGGSTTVSRVDHYKDGSTTDTENSTPWTYNDAFHGLVQKRDPTLGDLDDTDIVENTPIYPFFPTKMRFGTGGLDAQLQPLSDIPTSQKKLNADSGNPFILIDRQRTTDHISVSQSGGVTNNKVNFSVKLPGGDPDYPYNDMVISEAGLYCDAALRVGDTDLTMRTGMLLSYRTFHGITKNESSDITFHWSWRF